MSEPTKFERIHQLLRYTNFFWSGVVRVIFVRQFVHLTTYFFTATHFNHVLAESLITDELVVNTLEISLTEFPLERIRDEVFVIPFLLPVAVAVGVALS